MRGEKAFGLQVLKTNFAVEMFAGKTKLKARTIVDQFQCYKAMTKLTGRVHRGNQYTIGTPYILEHGEQHFVVGPVQRSVIIC